MSRSPSAPQDPVAFLRNTPPFDRLPEPAFAAAARQLEIAFHPAGTRLLREGDAPLDHLLVIRKGAVRLERGGATVLVLEEGELLGLTSLVSPDAPLGVVVEDDLLAYRLPRTAVEPLVDEPAFARRLAAGLVERLRHGLATRELPSALLTADLSAPASSLVRRAPVTIGRDATVFEAARRMREHGVSALLVGDTAGGGAIAGILTDRDLRNRVLAEGRGPDVPVGEVCSPDVRTVSADTPVHLAWAALLDAGVHHLPVVRGDEVIGMITGTDLLRQTAHGPMSVLRWVQRLPGREGLAGYAGRVADMTASLLAGGLDAVAIAGFVARLSDALLARILRWAEADLGPAPAPYAWLALGSEGRGEQTLLTDQDNALVFADGVDEAGAAWFARLAERAVADLVSAGFPPCPGGVMATRWRGPMSSWEERFEGWTRAADPQLLLESCIFLDFRRVAGTLDVEPLDRRVRDARTHRVFLQCLARAALDFRPPGAIELRLRGAASRIDLKKHGLVPIVGLARCHAIEVGSPARSTIERLAAASASLLDRDTEARIAEAFRFFLRLRLREQLRARALAQAPSDEVALAQLDAVERRALKDALGAVRDLQAQASFHYRTGLF